MAFVPRRARPLLGALLLATTPALAGAQAPTGRAPAATNGTGQGASTEPGATLSVYLMTMGPGDAVWEKFGHNAIWIRDTTRGLDVAYNWGLFDFNDADFIPRFLKGSMRYSMGGYAGRETVDAYASYNRSVWAQELALTPAQKQELLEFVRWNARPENRYYHYDYFRDNCSTRVRDAIDRVLGGQLKAALDTVATGTTYRWHTRRLTQGSLSVYTGMDAVLGPRGDRPLSAWEEAFLPMSLRDHIRGVSLPAFVGGRPLVTQESELFTATRVPEPERPANLIFGFLAVGVFLAGIFVYCARLAAEGHRAGRIGMAALGAGWSLFAAFIGTVMVLSRATDHVFMHGNENLFQLSPLSWILVPLLITVAFAGRRTVLTMRIAAMVAGFSAIGLLVQALPRADQVNGEVIALALPIHLGIAWGTWLMAALPRRTRPASARAEPAFAHAPTAGASPIR